MTKFAPTYHLKTDAYSSHRQIARLIYKYIPKGGSIFDAGCDVGFLGQLLRQNTKKYILHGADINKENLKRARRHYEKVFCFDLNLRIWPVQKRYDAVVIADTLEHLLEPAQVLERARKILKPGGTLIISLPNSVFWVARLLIVLGHFPKAPRGIFDKTHLHFYTNETATALLKSQNWHISTRYQTTLPLQFIFARLGILTLVTNLIYRFSYILANIYPPLFAYQFIYICK